MIDLPERQQPANTAGVKTRGDVVFSATMHLRLLLRVDRTQSIRQALRSVIRPGARVLDAGCGSGLLSFLAIEAGASQVVAVDRDNIELARALAHANGMADRIQFIEADLTTLDPSDLPGPFDAILAFVYTNHMLVDEARSRAVAALRRQFAAAACVTVPNRVRYWAIPCDWPAHDAATELADLGDAIADMEGRYGLKFGPLLEAATAEILFDRARPPIHGERKWQPASANGGYRHPRGAARFLGERTLVAEFQYDAEPEFIGLPDLVTVESRTDGVATAMMWVQELWFDQQLIWTAEAISPIAAPLATRPGDRLEVRLDAAWRATNTVSVSRTR